MYSLNVVRTSCMMQRHPTRDTGITVMPNGVDYMFVPLPELTSKCQRPQADAPQVHTWQLARPDIARPRMGHQAPPSMETWRGKHHQVLLTDCERWNVLKPLCSTKLQTMTHGECHLGRPLVVELAGQPRMMSPSSWTRQSFSPEFPAIGEV
jgi:hypothetical protein